jgi:hypothetical protein
MPTVIYSHNADFRHNELRNAHAQKVAGLPSAQPEYAGWFVFNTTDSRWYYCTGSSWELKATNSDALNGQAAAFYLSRANHTGTQPASSISDLTGAITATPLNSFQPPTGPVAMGGQRITGGAPGIASTDFATVGQASDIANNLGFKLVKAASTANVAIASTGNGATIDGVALATGNRVLLKDQTDGTQNGIYSVGTSSLTRATDADSASDLPPGTIVVVEQGTANADKMWMLTTNSGYVMGVTALVFAPYGNAPNPYTAGNGINITGQVISAVAGSGILVTSGGIAVDPTVYSKHVEMSVPAPGSGTAVTLTHSLNRRPVPIAVMETSTGDKVTPGINYPDANSVTLDFSVAPTNGQYTASIG